MAPSKIGKTSALDAKKDAKAKGKKPSRSAVGAPSQHTQASRKGKRAWRKNVNIEDVEEVLEGLRAEERVVGCVSSVVVFLGLH
jgi:nucleolar protein 53